MQEKQEKHVIKVLIVDDIQETRENIKKLLSFEEEFKVVGSVGTGREALSVTLETRPDIVIMDINMPDMDGIQATNEITKAVPTAAVIMMSVQTDADYMRKAMQAGARQFLGKPIDPDELYSTIRSVYQELRADPPSGDGDAGHADGSPQSQARLAAKAAKSAPETSSSSTARREASAAPPSRPTSRPG